MNSDGNSHLKSLHRSQIHSSNRCYCCGDCAALRNFNETIDRGVIAVVIIVVANTRDRVLQ